MNDVSDVKASYSSSDMYNICECVRDTIAELCRHHKVYEGDSYQNFVPRQDSWYISIAPQISNFIVS